MCRLGRRRGEGGAVCACVEGLLTELVACTVEVDGLQREVVPRGVGSGPAHHGGAWGEGVGVIPAGGCGACCLTVCSQLYHRAKSVSGDDDLLAIGQGGWEELEAQTYSTPHHTHHTLHTTPHSTLHTTPHTPHTAHHTTPHTAHHTTHTTHCTPHHTPHHTTPHTPHTAHHTTRQGYRLHSQSA